MHSQKDQDGISTPNQRRHYRQNIKKRLKTIQARITKLTNRIPPLPSRIQFFDDDKLIKPTFCGTYKNTKFHLAYQLIHRPLLLDTVLYREMYTILLPLIVKEVPESGDLGLLCAYQHLSEEHHTQFLQIWQVVSPPRYYGDITYNAPRSFPRFNRVTQETFLKRILPFFDELEPASSVLTTREFVNLLETFMLNYTSSLNEQELRLLHLVQKNPTATLKQLKKLSSFSIGSLSNYMTRFREKLLLSRFYRVNFPRIRLNHIAILAYPAPGSQLSQYLEHCPYLRKIHRLGGSGSPYLLSYTLPRLRLRRLKEWLQELMGLGHLLKYRFYPLRGTFNGYNFRSYVANNSEIPVAERFRWIAWIRYLRDNLIRQGYGEVLEQPYLYEYSSPNVEPANLKPLDFRILRHITPESTAEDLANTLGESVHIIRRHQRNLFNQKVLFERSDLTMFHLGLNETLFIILEGSEEVLQNFLAGCREAPMYGGSVFHHPSPGCIVAFGLPTGLALRVGRELARLFLEQNEFDAAVFYGSGSKDFLMTSVLRRCKFNFDVGQWQWYREYFPTTFDHLNSQHSELHEMGEFYFPIDKR